MEILGIGPMELILILIVALLVFGPDKLPQIGAKLGHAMRDMRRATRAISEEINSTRAAIEAPAKELAEPFQDVANAAKAAGSVAAAARNPGQALRDSVLKELNAPLKSDAPAEPAAAEPENPIAPPELLAASAPPVAALPAPTEPPETEEAGLSEEPRLLDEPSVLDQGPASEPPAVPYVAELPALDQPDAQPTSTDAPPSVPEQ